MSCEGTMIGSPLAGESTLFEASISVRASICASSDSGTWTAIWSPSKSAVNAAHTRRGGAGGSPPAPPHLPFRRRRYGARHLVAVEVGVERGAHQRVQLDRLALDQHRLVCAAFN